jgi:hypothetical protein
MVGNKEMFYCHSFSLFALDYAIRMVQVNQDVLKLNDKQHPLVYADSVNILGGSVHTYIP